jgi:hypothetical protein
MSALVPPFVRGDYKFIAPENGALRKYSLAQLLRPEGTLCPYKRGVYCRFNGEELFVTTG